MPPTPLWLFAHRGLSTAFHRDPFKLVARLGSDSAPRYLGKLWSWAQTALARGSSNDIESFQARATDKPPLLFGITKVPDGVHLRMRFRDIRAPGEPFAISCLVRDGIGGRMFLLEYSMRESQRVGRPQAVVTETGADHGHRSWGVALDPHDDVGFDDAVVEILLQSRLRAT